MSASYQWSCLLDNGWVPYSQAQSDEFEDLFNKKATQIKVDNARFIDLTLTYNDIVSNFSGVNDKDLVGIQRRYDDHMKRRAVKRTKVSLNYFTGYKFAFMNAELTKKKSSTSVKDCQTNINSLGGTVSPNLVLGVNYIIITPKEVKNADAEEFNTIISKSESLKIVPVELNYVASCISAKKRLDHSPFIVGKKIVPPKPTPAAPATTTTPTPAVIPAATPTPTAKKLDASYLLVDSEWTGVCTVDGDHFPMLLKVEKVDGDQVSGTVHWATLGGAITKYKGTVQNGKFDFEEYELVNGDPDEIELPNKYEAGVVLESITGTVDGSNFQLKLTKSPSVSIMKPFTTYKGQVTQYDNFKLKVIKREDENVEGTIHWPYYNATAEFKGAIQEDSILVKQYKEGKELGPEIKVPFKVNVSKTKNQINMKIVVTN